MLARIKRHVLVILLFVVLVASGIVPVFIVLGFYQRYLWFVPYALFVTGLLYLSARADADGKNPVPWEPGLLGFVRAHVFLTLSAITGLILLIISWFGPLAAPDQLLPALAFLGLIVLAAGKYFSRRSAYLLRRPLWFETVVDAVAIIIVFMTVVVVAFQ